MSKKSRKKDPPERLRDAEQQSFYELCLAESYRAGYKYDESGIGIYNEKRLHRILKRTFCQNDACFEIGVGRYIADVLEDGHITEIQCGPFAPLKQKLKYYLNETDYSVCVVHPIIVKRTVIRAERESGEVKSVRVSPKKEDICTAIADLYPIGEFLTHERLTLRIMLIEAEEYRYSERVRYRKSGAYDSELFPTELVGRVELCDKADFMPYFTSELCGEFAAKDFAPYTRLRGRRLYSFLNVLSDIGVLRREKQGRNVKYYTI